MDCILAAKLLNVSNKTINKENIMSLYKAIDASCTIDEVESFISSVGERSLDDLITEGKQMMSAVSASAPAPAAAHAEKPEKAKEEPQKAEEEEVDDFDIFSGF